MGEAGDQSQILRSSLRDPHPLSPTQSSYPYSESKAEKVATTLEGLVCCLFLLLHVFLSGIFTYGKTHSFYLFFWGSSKSTFIEVI